MKIDLNNALSSLREEIDGVNEWVESEYNKYFSEYFKGEVDLYQRMKSSKESVTDQELEWVLVELPMELFSVTEQLSKLRTAQEVIKMHIKGKQRAYIDDPKTVGSATQKKEEAAVITAEEQLLVNVYDCIIDRVAREMSFSKELIMSAKKIWDARRSDGIPIPDIVTNDDILPEYTRR